MKRRAILIAGPTASGKSGAAIGIARACGGVIVNADSMQVYRQLSVLTSRPGAEHERQADHELYGHVDARAAYSTGQWLQEAGAVLQNIWAAGRVAVITGGTGLYFKALDEGLARVPAIAPEIREKWRARLANDGPRRLHEELALRDGCEAARLQPGDGQRIVRALEVLEQTGKPLAQFHGGPGGGGLPGGVAVARYVIQPAREVLYERIDRRFGEMMEAGALEEVMALRALGIDAGMPVMKAIGVKALGGYLDGRWRLAEAEDMARRQTRNYAKRQMTWARGQMAHWHVAGSADELASACRSLPA